jgi:hypothetical protein
LTHKYLISGNISPDLSYETGLGLVVSSASFRPTRNLAVPAGSADVWTAANGDAVLALIPRDAACTEHMVKQHTHGKYPVAVEVYVGWYVIRGTVLSPNENDVGTMVNVSIILLQDAEIECVLPGAQLAPLTPPFVAVRRHLGEGIVRRM